MSKTSLPKFFVPSKAPPPPPPSVKPGVKITSALPKAPPKVSTTPQKFYTPKTIAKAPPPLETKNPVVQTSIIKEIPKISTTLPKKFFIPAKTGFTPQEDLRMGEIRNDLRDTKTILSNSMNSVLNREGKLIELQNSTENLKNSSKNFHMNARKINATSNLNWMKYAGIGGGVVAGGLGLVGGVAGLGGYLYSKYKRWRDGEPKKEEPTKFVNPIKEPIEGTLQEEIQEEKKIRRE